MTEDLELAVMIQGELIAIDAAPPFPRGRAVLQTSNVRRLLKELKVATTVKFTMSLMGTLLVRPLGLSAIVSQ